ncbi:hypothetical protein PQX77_014501, partial [Marasmius sp. AFHP31]
RKQLLKCGLDYENERLRKVAFKTKQKKVTSKDDGGGRARHLTDEENMKMLVARELESAREAVWKELKDSLKAVRQRLDTEAQDRKKKVDTSLKMMKKNRTKEKKAEERRVAKEKKDEEKRKEKEWRAVEKAAAMTLRGSRGRVSRSHRGQGRRGRGRGRGHDQVDVESLSSGGSSPKNDGMSFTPALSPPPSPTSASRPRPHPRRVAPCRGSNNPSTSHSSTYMEMVVDNHTGTESSEGLDEGSSDEERHSVVGSERGNNDEDDVSDSSDQDPMAEEEDDDTEETAEVGVDRVNGHHWIARTLQFNIAWSDGDVTWTSLDEDINDLEAMEVYLQHHGVTDPLKLPKKKYLIATIL